MSFSKVFTTEKALQQKVSVDFHHQKLHCSFQNADADVVFSSMPNFMYQVRLVPLLSRHKMLNTFDRNCIDMLQKPSQTSTRTCCKDLKRRVSSLITVRMAQDFWWNTLSEEVATVSGLHCNFYRLDLIICFADLDVGASELIIDGRIKLKQGQEISENLHTRLCELHLRVCCRGNHQRRYHFWRWNRVEGRHHCSCDGLPGITLSILPHSTLTLSYRIWRPLPWKFSVKRPRRSMMFGAWTMRARSRRCGEALAIVSLRYIVFAPVSHRD